MPPLDIKTSIQVGSKCIIAQDGDLRGTISIGSGTILHPRVTILALSGPIEIGEGCIFEENVAIINRFKSPMIIGSGNLFQVGCRIESPLIGSHNTFGIRCRTSPTVSIGSHCTIGAGCVVLCSPFATPSSLRCSPSSISASLLPSPTSVPPANESEAAPPPPPPAKDEGEVPMDVDATVMEEEGGSLTQEKETLSDFTVVYGIENKRRIWSGEGEGQNKALHAKHLVYLTETLPKFHKLKVFV